MRLNKYSLKETPDLFEFLFGSNGFMEKNI